MSDDEFGDFQFHHEHSGKPLKAKAKKARILGINVIPSTSWFNNVRSHFSKEDWDRLRRACYRKAGYKCEICGGKGEEWPVECHEVWEFNEKTQIQKLIRLISLCPMCHKCQHPGLAHMQGFGQAVITHYAKVNGISESEARKDYNEANKVWEKRSELEWDLDISVLTKGGV